MGRLDAITAALDSAQSTAADEAVQVQAHFDALRTQVSDLQAAVDDLTAGAVTDEEITALSDQVAGLSDTIEAIDTEGDVGPETPVEEVPVEDVPENPEPPIA